MRLYEIAKEHNINSKDLVFLLNDIDMNIKNHMTNIPEYLLPTIEEKIQKFKNQKYINKCPVKYIKIFNLFGKYNYEFNFSNSINIWVGHNGKGKTTILNIINAILTSNRSKLRKLPFEKVEIKLNDDVFVVDKRSLFRTDIKTSYYKNQIRNDLYKMRIPRLIIDELNDDLINEDYERFELKLKELKNRYYIDDTSIFENLYSEINKKNIIKQKNDVLMTIKKIINNNVIFLQTFRRIEADLDEFEDYKLKSLKEIKNSQINFGMRDVEIIIEEKTQELKDMAFVLYSELSGNIINDLVDDKINKNKRNYFDLEKVKVVLKRIGNEKVDERKISDYIDSVNNKKDSFNNVFLSYYIDKLLDIYEKQKPIDDRIKSFAHVCNKYFIDKYVDYDESLVKVTVKSKNDDEILPFTCLSSGEKQIIAIFAKLYIEIEEPQIFIIDEPELSLSIEWQKMLLQDIYESKKVYLLIATTHSPFIFKNDFSDYTEEIIGYESN